MRRLIVPIYEYICEKCGKEEEVLQSVNDPPPMCCEQKMKKQISLSSFILKGTGWYKTDYADKEKTNG